jgi:hypothetical protein
MSRRREHDAQDQTHRRQNGQVTDGARAAMLHGLIEDATVDAHDESEQTTGLYTMFEDHLAMPFKTDVLGMEVLVERLDITDDDGFVPDRIGDDSHAAPDSHSPYALSLQSRHERDRSLETSL